MTSGLPTPVTLSVVVPTRDRNEQLAKCLERLASGSQSLDKRYYDVIVTDDGTADAAQELVQARFPWAAWVAGPRRGPAANRNRGALSATGDWIAFVDDDCLPDPGWLAAIAAEATTGRTDVIEGRTVCPDKTDNPFEEQVENLDGGVLWSCNFGIRRSTFEQVRGFDEDFADACFEDMELHARLRNGGWRIRFCPDALVLHPARKGNLADLWRKTLRHRWMVLFQLKTHASTNLCWEMFVSCVRITVMTARDLQASRWKRQAFTVCWQWLTFPVLLPYLLIWQHRFRPQLEKS